MEYLITACITAGIIGLVFAGVKHTYKENEEWRKRKARKAQIKKVK